MAKKFDFNALKPVLFQYGDKAVLGLAVLATVALIGMGLVSAKNASKTDWADELKKAADSLNSRILAAEAPPADKKKMEALDPKLYDWTLYRSQFVPGAYIHLTETADVKRRNPLVLDVRAEEDNFQLDYINGLYYCYAIHPQNLKIEVFGSGKATGGAAGPALGGAVPGQQAPVKAVDYLRMVVVQGVFPMRDQVEQFKRAFRLNNQAELFASKDWPRPLGLDVYRVEVLPNGTLGKEEKLYTRDKKDNVELAKPINEVLRRALFDEETLHGLEAYVHAGLVTPLPQLANARYPKLKLAAIEPAPSEVAGKAGQGPGMLAPGGTMPGANMMAGGAAAGGHVESVSWRSFPQAERFEGRFEPFHPLAEPLAKAEDKGNAPAVPPSGPGMRPGMMPPGMAPGGTGGTALSFSPFEAMGLGGAGAGPAGSTGPRFGAQAPTAAAPAGSTDTWRHDALVRFIDVGVEPGKTYCYKMRVRLANPNYGKKDEVAYADLANIKEIESVKWVRTPAKHIPLEYHYYAVDQQLLDKGEKAAANAVTAAKNEQTTVQIQRWFDNAKDLQNGREYVIGDWAVAERLLVRRGEFIGQYSLLTEVPVWSKEKGAFEVPQAQVPDAKTKKVTTKDGIPLDFVPPLDASAKGEVKQPLLVDFEGGRRDSYRIKQELIRDESSVEVLLLTPDGKLTIRNSGRDTDPKSAEGRQRRDHLERWRDHVHNAQATAERSNNTANPASGVPGVPGLPGIGPKKN